ncbi:MAG: glycosyltransferase [Spirochaetales bacterium]|nr:glycosyltransferase [Spirochaetales bacterium]
MKKAKKKRVFLGPCEVAGYCSNLNFGFKEIKQDVSFIDLWDHPFDYGGNDNGLLENILRKFKKAYCKNTKKQLLKKLVFGFLNILFSLIYFIKAVFSYDVFIFIFGYSLLPNNIDLPVLKFFRKKIIFNIALGSEARPPYMNGVYQNKDGSGGLDLKVLEKLTRKIKKRVSGIEAWSDIVIGSPFSSSQFTTKKFVNYFDLGFPRKVTEVPAAGAENNACIILHSPSHPAAKGSFEIIEAVENLKQRGYEIEFILLKDKTNKEVLEELSKCDFVVDQLYSDTPLAGFACEAAVFGKAAVVGGYALKEFQKYIHSSMMPPSVFCKPDELLNTIELMITDKELRKSAGKASSEFINVKWSAAAVAGRYQDLLFDEIKEEMFVDPLNIEYLYGVGQSQERTKEIVASMVKTYGKSSLQLDHNPVLRDKLLKFAGMSD